MRASLRRIAFGVLFLVACPGSLWAQQATINHNANVRRDPSSKSPVLERVVIGDRLMLVDTTPDSGFYHVRTEDDRVGWVYAKYVSISQMNPPVTPTNPTPTNPTPTNPTPTNPTPTNPIEPTNPQPTDTCDPNLWNHVYHSYRLIVKQQCMSVTGTIVDATASQSLHQPDGVRHEGDGDTHGWLKVDPEFQNLLNAGNDTDEAGSLVFEIVCRFPVTQQDAQASCQGYTDNVTLPPVGSHVRIVGTYVQDTFHAKWMEIHPVTSISVIP